MDSEDDLLFIMLGVTLVLSISVFQRRSPIRRFWVNPYLRSRGQTGRFNTGVSFYEKFSERFNINYVNEKSMIIVSGYG